MVFAPRDNGLATCSRSAHNLVEFQSWARSVMLGQSRFGSLTLMTASTKPKSPLQVKRPCPDCGTPLLKRSSNSEHLLLSKTFLVCKNAVCGATFAGIDEITHRLSPPSQPNAEIRLPYAPSAIRRGVLVVLGLPTEREEPVRAAQANGSQENRS